MLSQRKDSRVGKSLGGLWAGRQSSWQVGKKINLEFDNLELDSCRGGVHCVWVEAKDEVVSGGGFDKLTHHAIV